MSHNSVHYLKKLPKKPPPGCSKLENFGFGKHLIQGEHSAKINQPSTSDNHSEPSNVRSDNQCSSNTPHPSSDKPPSQTTKDDYESLCPRKFVYRLSSSERSRTSTKSQSECPTFKFDGRKFVSLKLEQMFNWLYYSNAKGGYTRMIYRLFSRISCFNASI